MTIRPETTADHTSITSLVQQAFANEPLSDQQEHLLVQRLRDSDAYLPGLALVAEEDDIIVGFILLTTINIVGATDSHPALALAPVAVLPSHQGRGIGGSLIRVAHRQAREQGHERIVLLGHDGYYPRFGYQPCHLYGITLPFPAPPECCMVIGLTDSALENVGGMVKYSTPFGM